MFAVAVLQMHIQPSEFWRMTPRELDLLANVELERQDRKAGRLTRPELAELHRIGQEAVEKEKNGRA